MSNWLFLSAQWLEKSPLGWLLHAYYQLAIWALSRWLGRNPTVESLYLTGSAARGALVPGVSDIDFMVVFADGADNSQRREKIQEDLALLRKGFPMLSDATQAGIFSRTEFSQVYARAKPHLFSIAGNSRLLWSHVPTLEKIDYHRDHEKSALVYLWTKVIIWIRADHGTRYHEYLLSNIEREILACENRLEIEAEIPKNEVPIRGVLRRFWNCFGAIDTLVVGRTESVEIAASATPIQIPNFLFLETSPLSFVGDKNATPARLSVIAFREDPPILPDWLIVRAIKGKDADFFCWRGRAVPLKLFSDMRLIDRIQNRLSFAAIDAVLDSETQRITKFEGRFPAEVYREAFLKFRNNCSSEFLRAVEMGLRDFFRDTKVVFFIPPERLVFAVALLSLWENKDHHADSLGWIRRLSEMESLLLSSKVTEAYFEAKLFLEGKDGPRPKVGISVLIPTRNRSGLLMKAVNSVLAQTLPPDEIIVVDNCSTDNTSDVIRNLRRINPKVKYFLEARIGVSYARNRALRESDPHCEVMAFLDDDCVAAPNWLYELSLPFRYDESVVSVGGDVAFDENDKTLWGDFYLNLKRGGRRHDHSA